MISNIYIISAIIIVALALGLGLGLGLKKDDDDKPVQVYGIVTKKNKTNEDNDYISNDKVWVYPLYTSEETAKKLFPNNYHFHMCKGCNKKYYMSNDAPHTFNQTKNNDMDVNTCDGKLPEPSSNSGGSSGGSSGGYGGY